MRKIVLKAHLFERGGDFSIFGFCLPLRKNTCAELGIAKMARQLAGRKKGEGNNKLKAVSSFLNCYYETLFLSECTFLETEMLIV
jgi:hypothetical protein